MDSGSSADAASADKIKAIAPNEIEVLCHEHPLKKLDLDNGWACNGERLPGGCRRGLQGFYKSSGIPRYQCAACDFDLCDMCLDVHRKFPPNPPLLVEQKSEEEDEEKKNQIPEIVVEDDDSLLPKIYHFYKHQEFVDVYFYVGDEKIPAQRLPLAMSSPIFAAMLYPYQEVGLSAPLEVKIADTTADLFNEMLLCVYSDQARITEANIDGLYALALKYYIRKLLVHCADYIGDRATKLTALDLFNKQGMGLEFIEQNAEVILLQEGVMDLSKGCLTTILKSDYLACDEVIVFKAFQKWIEAEKKRKGEEVASKTARSLLRYIRFATMDVQDLVSLVMASGYLSKRELKELIAFCSIPDEELRLDIAPTYAVKPRLGMNWNWDQDRSGSQVKVTDDFRACLKVTEEPGAPYDGGFTVGKRKFERGSHYWEIKIDGVNNVLVGVCLPTARTSGMPHTSEKVWMLGTDGTQYGDFQLPLTLSNSGDGARIGLFLEYNVQNSAFSLTYYLNGIKLGTPFTKIPTPVQPCVALSTNPCGVKLFPRAKRPS